MQARVIASRRLGLRVRSLARAHPLCDARHAGDAVGQNPMDMAEAERSGLAVAAASTLDAGEDLTSLTASAAAAAAAAAATVEASAQPKCLRQASRQMCWWLLLALLLAPARAGCGTFIQKRDCKSRGNAQSLTATSDQTTCGNQCANEGVAGCCYLKTGDNICEFTAGAANSNGAGAIDTNTNNPKWAMLCTVSSSSPPPPSPPPPSPSPPPPSPSPPPSPPPPSPPPWPPTTAGVLLHSGAECGTHRSPSLGTGFADQHECLTRAQTMDRCGLAI
eukprot:scaffold59771_cov58-Phaeocystis_antarctica.AAC.2